MSTLCLLGALPSRLAACLLTLGVLTGTAAADAALDYGVTGAAVHDNLSVYFVHGNGAGSKTAPMTLDEAVGTGQAKLRWSDSDTPVTVENLSDRSIFVPFATLLTGGLQDQVTRTSLLLPPHSGPVPLATFCVDPFRSTAREGENPTMLGTNGFAYPGRTAQLAMLVDAPRSRSVTRLRQAAVWWNIDTLRGSLAEQLGGPVEPPRPAHWNTDHVDDQVSSFVLAARQSHWLTSLPLMLENVSLQAAQQAYVDEIEGAADRADDVIGAVFSVNGHVDGAEIYQSHALFAAMWPSLLRAHAVEAIAAKSATSEAATSVTASDVENFLAAAQAGTTRAQGKGQYLLRDSDAAVFAETRAADGSFVNRSYLARSAPAADTPDGAILKMLETGVVDNRPLASLSDRAFVTMRRDAAGSWTAAIAQFVPRFDFTGTVFYGSPGDRSMVIPILMAFSFFGFLFWVAVIPQRSRRDDIVRCRIGAGESRVFVVDGTGPRRQPSPTAARTRRVDAGLGASVAASAHGVARAMVAVTAKSRVGQHAVARGRAAFARWVAGMDWGELVRRLGPAWPGNLRPPPLRVVPIRGPSNRRPSKIWQ